MCIRGLDLYPQHELLRKEQGVALIKLDRPQEAIDVFERLKEKNDFHMFNYNLACAHSKMHSLQEALACLAKSIEQKEYCRYLATVDPDFDNIWDSPLFQAVVYQSGRGVRIP